MEFLLVIIKQARKYMNTGTMVSVLVECRRLVSLLFVPWISVVLICILLSWYSVFVIGLDALLAPVLKTWLLLKPFLIYVYKGGIAVLLWAWVQTIGKFSGWIGEMFMLVVGYLGGWKAWSFKKCFVRVGALSLLSQHALCCSVLS